MYFGGTGRDRMGWDVCVCVCVGVFGIQLGSASAAGRLAGCQPAADLSSILTARQAARSTAASHFHRVQNPEQSWGSDDVHLLQCCI